MNKRGATTQTVIVSIIILLISGGIIFYFFSILPYRDMIDKQMCYQSVILRDNMFLKGEFGPEKPLNCKTQKIEISETNEVLIKREIANQMYDCWWMLGEGKMNFFMREPTVGNPSYCVLCSTIKFDENVQEKIKEIKGFDKYLFNTKIPKKNITYWDYISGGEAPLKELPGTLDLKTDKEYAIIYSLVESSTLTGYASGAAIAALVGAGIGTIVLPGAGTAAGFVAGAKIAGFCLGVAGTAHISGEVGEKFQDFIQKEGYVVIFSIIPLEADAIKTFGCSSIESIP